jgi:hypothetical protein
MFLVDCVNLNLTQSKKRISSVFYGNIDTSKYKSGNSKSDILPEVLKWVSSKHWSRDEQFHIICKKKDFDSISDSKSTTHHIDRKDRSAIWETLESSRVMLNITKEKYNEIKFIPARIYEAMIFGMIPVSYKFDFLCPAFSFESIEDLLEIYEYFYECDAVGLEQAYKHFINSYLNIHSN